MKKLDPLYTVAETAEILNVSLKTKRRLGPAVLRGDTELASELPGVHRRCADVAGFDDIVQWFERPLDRGVVARVVDVIEIDLIGTETPQAVIDLAHDRLRRQAADLGPGRSRP